MRVATTALPDLLVRQLHDLGSRQIRLQAQAATGQRVQRAGDDPTAMRQALEIQTATEANAQYGRNIGSLQQRVGASLDAIQSIQRVADRAAEITTLAGGTRSPQELKAYAAEIDQLIRQAAQTANTKVGNDFLFSGTRTDRPPFVLNEDAAGQVTSVSYQGNEGVAPLEIAPGVSVVAQIPGSSTGGGGVRGLVTDSRTGADLFGHLIALRQHLEAGDTEAIAASDHGALQADEEHLISRLAESGALQARLEVASANTASQGTRLADSYSRVAEADLPSTLVDLTATQTAYQVALQSGARLMQTSLMDYLR